MDQKSKRALTSKFVENLKPPKEGVREYWDAALPGFGLRVFAPSTRAYKGTKSWCLMVRINGKQKRIKLGRYPAKGLHDARRDASKIRDDIERGIDPTKKPEPEPGSKTFGSIAEDYIRLECPRLGCGTDVESAIRRRLLPYWKDRAIGELRRVDATERIDAVMDEGKPSAANSLYSLIGRIGHRATARGDLDVPLKTQRFKQWCEDINWVQSDVIYDFVFVDEYSFKK